MNIGLIGQGKPKPKHFLIGPICINVYDLHGNKVANVDKAGVHIIQPDVIHEDTITVLDKLYEQCFPKEESNE